MAASSAHDQPESVAERRARELAVDTCDRIRRVAQPGMAGWPGTIERVAPYDAAATAALCALSSHAGEQLARVSHVAERAAGALVLSWQAASLAWIGHSAGGEP